MSNDNEIIRRIRQGDEKEFESLFRSSYVSLVRYAQTIIRDNEEAEEIVQDLFVRLWQEREKWIVESSLNGYLQSFLFGSRTAKALGNSSPGK